MSRLFRKKPVVVSAEQWFPGRSVAGVNEYTDVHEPLGERGRFYVDTLEGPLRVSPGDWIVTGTKGEHWPVRADIFAATYEPVEVRIQPAPRSGT